MNDSLLDQSKKYAGGLAIDLFSGARKRPFNKQEFADLITGAQTKGHAEVLDLLMQNFDKDLTYDEFKGEIHLLRQKIWNDYVKAFPDRRHKPITLDQAMRQDPWGVK